MYPISRTYMYSKIKRSFVTASYLDTVKNHKYRIAMVQLRTSSHTLAIERGRYATPMMHIICNICGTVEDEIHFHIHCPLYKHERGATFSYITRTHPKFQGLSHENNFIILWENTDELILIWTGKLIYKSFRIRAENVLNENRLPSYYAPYQWNWDFMLRTRVAAVTALRSMVARKFPVLLWYGERPSLAFSGFMPCILCVMYITCINAHVHMYIHIVNF